MPRIPVFKVGLASVAAAAGLIFAISSVAAHATNASKGDHLSNGARAAAIDSFRTLQAPLTAENAVTDEQESDAIEAAEKAAALAAEQAAEAAEQAAEQAAQAAAAACKAADQPEDTQERAGDQTEDSTETKGTGDQAEDTTERANDKTEDAAEPKCRPVEAEGPKSSHESSEHHDS